MAKCKLCGKKGLFLKLNEQGICPDCLRLAEIKKMEEAAQSNLNKLKQSIQDEKSYISKIQERALREIDNQITEKNVALNYIRQNITDESIQYQELQEKVIKSQKTVDSNLKKVSKLKELFKAMEYSIENFCNPYSTPAPAELMYASPSEVIKRIHFELQELYSPTVEIPLHCMDMKELRKRFKQAQADILSLSEKYQSRYTTKANATIYKLMVIALQAELQNILYNLNYGKIDSAITNVKTITSKYTQIATEGNQSIAPTIIQFIGQLEYLFIEAVKIEYEYFTQKEKIKEEQKALREQIRQEMEERKILQQQQKQVEREEEKYRNEIEALKASLQEANEEKESILQARIKKLEEQLSKVNEKKSEIINLQNGKAGYVYVISNLGSFGDNVFKIGMTRRLEPQERIDELGSASVPFPFDVHSFIFSNDAVGLENNIHKRLNEQRLNKVNFRKEFFKISIDELENLVTQLEPSAEFKKTMLAEQYKQSLSIASGIMEAFEDVMDNIAVSDSTTEE